jgi:hypothetical protein
MKKIAVREVETLKTTAALYASGCGVIGIGPVFKPNPVVLRLA